MFDISFVEIALVLVIALLVLGPERLPRAAKMVGLWIRRAKASWFSVKAEFERELADEELKRSLQQAQRDITEAKKDFEAATREPVAAVGEVGRATDEATRSLKQSIEADAAGTAPASAPEPGKPDAASSPGAAAADDGDRPAGPRAAPGPVAPDQHGDDAGKPGP